MNDDEIIPVELRVLQQAASRFAGSCQQFAVSCRRVAAVAQALACETREWQAVEPNSASQALARAVIESARK